MVLPKKSWQSKSDSIFSCCSCFFDSQHTLFFIQDYSTLLDAKIVIFSELQIFFLFSIPFHKIPHQPKHRPITIENGVLVGVEDGVVVLESVALLVLEEDAGHVARGKRVMVAVGGQLASVQALEMVLLIVDLLKQGETAHSLVADFAILHGVVVANHVNVE